MSKVKSRNTEVPTLKELKTLKMEKITVTSIDKLPMMSLAYTAGSRRAAERLAGGKDEERVSFLHEDGGKGFCTSVHVCMCFRLGKWLPHCQYFRKLTYILNVTYNSRDY